VEIGQLVAGVFWRISRDERYAEDQPTYPRWHASRNLLRHALAGTGDGLTNRKAMCDACKLQQANPAAALAVRRSRLPFGSSKVTAPTERDLRSR